MPKHKHYPYHLAVSMRLKMWRGFRGLNQRDCADALEVTPQQYSKFEAAQNGLSLAQAIIIARHLRISLNELTADVLDGWAPPRV